MSHLRQLFCVNKKFLIYNLVMRNLKIKYRESFLGYLWTMAIPACQISISYLLYRVIFKVDIPHYLIFLISGLLPWTFFSTVLSESMESISSNAALLNQMPIPIQIFPNTSAITNMINFLAAAPIALLVFLTSGLSFHMDFFMLVPLVGLFYIMALALGLIFSVLYIYFKDLKHVTSLLLQVWFYATPIVYNTEMVPPKIAPFLFYLNPVAGFFIVFRGIIFGERIQLSYLCAMVIWSVILLTAAYIVMKRYGNGVVERL